MSSWKNAVVTQKGLNLQAKMVEGNSLKITKAVAGAGYVSPGLLQQQTAVSTIKGVLLIKSVKYPEPGVCAIRVSLSNAGVSTEYMACQIGIYAEDPDEGEILYFIAQAESANDGVDVSTEADVPSFAAEWEFYFQYGTADGVNVTVSPANTVSRQEMEEFHDETIGSATQDALNDKADAPVAKTGELVAATGSANAPLHGLSLYGKTTQESTTGAQLFDFDAWSSVFVMHGTAEISGNKITLTATGEDCYTAYAAGQYPVAARVAVTPGENYVLSWETDAESAAKNEVYVFFEGLTEGMKSVNAALKQIAFTAPAGVTFITIRFGVRAIDDSASYWDIMVNTGYEKAAYEPYTGGKVSPSPEYPQELTSVGEAGSIAVNVLGSNLLDHAKWSQSVIQGGTGEYKDNGVVITAGDNGDAYTSYSLTYSQIPCVSGVKYVLTWEHTGAAGIVYIFPNGKAADWLQVSTVDASRLEYTPAEGVSFFTFRFGCMAAHTTATYKNIRINVQKDAGFEEYKPLQTMTVSTPDGLPGIQVTSGGNYTDADGRQWICDEVDLDRGVYVKRVHRLELTGNETINRTDDSTWAAGCYAVYPIDNPEFNHTEIMCSFLPHHANNYLANDTYATGIGTHGTFGLLVRFGADINTRELFTAAWQAAVAAGGTIMVALTDPVETALTASQIAAYAALRTYEPGTTVYNTDGSAMKVEYYSTSSALPAAGGHMSGPIDMGGNKITGLSDPEAGGDAVPLGYAKKNYSAAGHKHGAGDINSGTLSSERLPTVPITKGGTGATTARAAEYNIFNDMAESTNAITDDDPIVVKRVSSASATNGALLYKTASRLWTYIAGKIRSVFGFTSSNVLPVANGGTGATTAANALKNLGLTATAAELNYVDGVTSAIQTQLDARYRALGSKNGDLDEFKALGCYWAQFAYCTNTPWGDNPSGKYGFVDNSNSSSASLTQKIIEYGSSGVVSVWERTYNATSGSAKWWPWTRTDANGVAYRKGDSYETVVRTAGYTTDGATKVCFMIPTNKPIMGSPTVTLASVNGFVLRQNQKYTHGSTGSSDYTTPDSYTVEIMPGVGLSVIAKFSDVTNAINNESIGVFWHGTVTFS